MMSARSLAISISWAVLANSLIHAQDLSRYREFDEHEIQDWIAVDEHIENLEREVFFTPNAALV
jgi:hypothetical protein